MAKQKPGKLNRLARLLPEGLLVDAAWMGRHGYSTSLRRQYVTAGWLEQPARRVYRRPRGAVSWREAVVSLQTLLDADLVVGGRTALELQGFSHYLTERRSQVHLYGPEKPPGWLYDLPVRTRFVYHNNGRLFGAGAGKLRFKSGRAEAGDFVTQPWGVWEWQLRMSSPERAILELLDELPKRESFHQVDKLFEGLVSLSPRRVERLLERCRSVKVNRLFYFFADRHQHAWWKRVKRSAADLGTGKRVLARGGRLDRVYRITVPKDLDGVG